MSFESRLRYNRPGGWFPSCVGLIAHCTSPRPQQSFGAHLEVAEDRRRVREAAPSAAAECRFRLFLLNVGKRFCKSIGPERKTGNTRDCLVLVADCCVGNHTLFTYGPSKWVHWPPTALVAVG